MSNITTMWPSAFHLNASTTICTVCRLQACLCAAQMKCYIERMEKNVAKWFQNILVVDLEVGWKFYYYYNTQSRAEHRSISSPCSPCSFCPLYCLQHEPKSGPNGKLRTPGVVDFFRILNEEMEVGRLTGRELKYPKNPKQLVEVPCLSGQPAHGRQGRFLEKLSLLWYW